MAENNSFAPLKTAGEPFVALGECIADQVCLSVAELPDRDSPADWPQAMLVTSDELRNIVLNAINYAAQAVAAQAAPAAVAVPDDLVELAMLNKLIELGSKAAYESAKSSSDDGPHGTAAFVRWQELRADMRALIHATYPSLATPALPATEDSSAGDLAEVPDGFGSAEHWKEKAQYWAGVAHELRGQALRGEPVDGIIQPTSQAEVQAEPVIYVSRGQLETHTDPDSDGGRYLPARRTPLGLLNYPLYSAPQAQPGDALTKAARDALAERARQINVEGWTPEHDDEHRDGSLSIAAACYALTGLAGSRPGALSPHYLAAWVGWGEGWFKPSSRRRNLEKAIALLIADMERLDRAAMAAAQEGGTTADQGLPLLQDGQENGYGTCTIDATMPPAQEGGKA